MFEAHKIHVKNAKGKKDRTVMLPYSIVTSLQLYRELYKGKYYVFESQFAREPYSVGSVQQVMRNALKISGLEKKQQCIHYVIVLRLIYWKTVLIYDTIYTAVFRSFEQIYTHLTKTAIDKIQSPLNCIVDLESKKKLDE